MARIILDVREATKSAIKKAAGNRGYKEYILWMLGMTAIEKGVEKKCEPKPRPSYLQRSS